MTYGTDAESPPTPDESRLERWNKAIIGAWLYLIGVKPAEKPRSADEQIDDWVRQSRKGRSWSETPKNSNDKPGC
jgi:hypothetical protein